MRIEVPPAIRRIFTCAECPLYFGVSVMYEILIPDARRYASRHQLEIAEPLGSGKDGIVLIAKRKGKPADVAIKVHFTSGRSKRMNAFDQPACARCSGLTSLN